MMTLITGGAKCGKSALAEKLLEGAADKVYMATMIPYGEEAHAAIARHRTIRAGKGFRTLELYTDLQQADVRGCSVLLECMGNLCANELFREDGPAEKEDAPEKTAETDPQEPEAPVMARVPDTAAYIIEGIHFLRAQAKELVIVTNQVGADGMDYAGGTMAYIRLLGEVNRAAAQMADTVIECVYGIPVVLKGNLQLNGCFPKAVQDASGRLG